MTYTIRIQDNRARYGYYVWTSGPRGIVLQRWRPSPLWQLAHWWRRLTGQRRSV